MQDLVEVVAKDLLRQAVVLREEEPTLVDEYNLPYACEGHEAG